MWGIQRAMEAPGPSQNTSTPSKPTGWCDAAPPPLPRLIGALQRAALARELGVEPQWPLIDRYRACGKLGQGGMSTVWEARDEALGRRVAIKLLQPIWSSDRGDRLRREAQALARFSHPNVVQVYEVVEIEGLTAVVMELVEGPTLRQWQEQSPRPGWKECVALYVQAGRGLAAVHAAGFVHRDFKAENCIVDEAGRVRVLDFGLVTREHDEETLQDPEPWPANGSVDARLTQTGTLVGTLAYMPPERLLRRSGGDGAAGDQFSFCTSLYEALYGARPFCGQAESELAAAIEQGLVAPVPRRSKVPPGVRRSLLRGLAAEPSRRWPAMEDLLAKLESIAAPPMRWRGLGIATASSAAVVAAMLMVMGGSSEPQCAGAGAQLEGIWDDERRQAVQAAILGTGTQHATDTWARIEPALDEYSRRWVAKHTEVCEATRVFEAQTEEDMGLRMHCLSSQRIALREAVGVLRQSDETTRANAIELVASLPDLSRCDDLEALQAQMPLPEDPEQAAAVGDARARLFRVRARREGGAYASSGDDADAVVEEAMQLGYEPLVAEALLERGELWTKWLERDAHAESWLELGAPGDPRSRKLHRRQAEVDLEEAYDLAVRIEHRQVETRAASLLARLVSDDPSRFHEANRWGRTALSLAERRGTDAVLMAEVANAMVLVAWGWRAPDELHRSEMLALQRRALALYEDARSSSYPAVAETFESAGDVLLRGKDPERAQEQYENALGINERLLGSSHPAVAAMLEKLGNALLKQHEPEMALEAYERALAIEHAELGVWHPSAARTWTLIGMALHMQGRLEEALTCHELALDMMVATFGRENDAVIGILSEIGFVLRDQGRIEDALVYYEESIAIREAVHAPHGEVVALKNVARELVEHGRPDLAEGFYRDMLAHGEASGASSYALIDGSFLLAETMLAQGRYTSTIQQVERTWPLFDELVESSPLELLARGRFMLARALWPERKRRNEARRLAELAQKGYAQLGQTRARELAEVTRWLDVIAEPVP